MEYNIKQPDGSPLDVASIIITDSNGNELIPPQTNTDSITVTNTDGLINGEVYTVTITFNTPIIRGEIERNCFTLAPTKVPTNAPTILQDIVCNDESIIEDYRGLTITEQTFIPGSGMKDIQIYIEDDNGDALIVDKITITDENGAVIKEVLNSNSIIFGENDGAIYDALNQYKLITDYPDGTQKVTIVTSCETNAPTASPTKSTTTQVTTTLEPTQSPTITNPVGCDDDLTITPTDSNPVIDEYTFGFTTDENTEGMEYEVTDENGDPIIVDSIIITDSDGNIIKIVNDTSSIIVDRTDGLETDEPYTVTIIFPSTPEICTSWLDRDNPSGFCDCESISGGQILASDLIPLNGCQPKYTTARLISNPSIEYTSANEILTSLNQVVTLTSDGLFCWNNRNPTGCLDYAVKFCCGSQPFTIDRNCFTTAPTVLPTLSPTPTQDIPCGDSSSEGSKNSAETTTFTFTNGGGFIGMIFSVTDGGNPLIVTSIVIIDTSTGQVLKSVSNTDSITVTEDDDGLVDSIIYSVIITYGTPGIAIEVERNCFTESPTTKPTESPVTSTRRPTTSPTITNTVDCNEELTVPATATEPVNEFTFDFTTDEDTEGMKYEITDENGNPIPAQMITITDKDGNIIAQVMNATEIIVDRTPGNGGLITDDPYTVTITFPTPQTTPFVIDRDCFTSAPTLQPTLSPTPTQDIPCDESEPIGSKNSGDTETFTFTNGGGFDGMTFTITDNNGTSLAVTSIKITDSNGNVLKEVTNTDSITVTNDDDNLLDNTEYTVTVTYGSGAESGSNIYRDCFTSAPTSKPTKSPTPIPEVECDDEEGVQTDEPIESFTFKFNTDDSSTIGMEFIVKDELGNELPVDKIIIRDSNGNIIASVDDVSSITALIDGNELSPNEDYTVEIIFKDPITTFVIERNCFTESPTLKPTSIPTSSPIFTKQELECGENLHVINDNGVYMTEFQFQAESPFTTVKFIIVDVNNSPLNVDSIVIKSLSGTIIKSISSGNILEFTSTDPGFTNSDLYGIIVDYDDNNILNETYVLKRCFTEAPTLKPTESPVLSPTTSPTIDTKCNADTYVPRTFDENDTNGLGLYSTSIDDNYLILQYKGNGDSFIRLCFSKDCQITGASSYTNSFFEITLDEAGNSGTYTLKYIDTDGSVTVLDTTTALDLTTSTEVDFYVAFDMLTDGIVFGNSDQVGQNILLSNDLTQCCLNYPSDVAGQRYTQPFRNIYYGSLGVLPSNSVEIKFCTEPIDLCPDFEIDYTNLIGYYIADNFINDFDTSGEVVSRGYIKDISYYGNNIESSQITNILSISKGTETVAGESINVISGDSSVIIDMDSPLNSDPILPTLYTLITVARRDPSSVSAGNEGAIFEASNFTSGFGPSGEIGYADREGTILSPGSTGALSLTEPATLATITVPSTSFIISSDKRSSYRVQGIDTTDTLPSVPGSYTNFGINTIPSNGASSSFEISEIMIFKTELTLDEICCVEYYLAERNKIRAENGQSLYSADTYPSCCIEVDEYPVYNPTDSDIIAQSNPAKISFLKELKNELFGNKYSKKAFAILFYIGAFINILLLICVCVLVGLKHNNNGNNNKKIMTYNNTSKWNDNESDIESDNEN